MNSLRRFTRVWILLEYGVYSRPTAGSLELDIERAYKRYLKVTGEEPLP